MNKNQYRIIFNARRGMRMAVAETVSSQGKAASGDSLGSTGIASGKGPGRTVLRLTVGASLLLLSGLLGSPVTAQVVADRTAPGNQQPTVLTTASGITQVNIQTPSAAGVSRNTYSQFDVDSRGVILNNSRTDTSTQIGGYVQANPWLATGGARVILNEVNSSSPSQLKGYVEVAGQRAEVIIANPAGIAVNGGGFLNASGVTLTTGTPVMNAGNLESFRVRGGGVTVSGSGLDTSTADYTNILARAVQVNAGIWANNLKVVTGANDISASSASAANVTATSTATAGGPTPTFALDVASIGGMYAGKIYLIGTEAGLGVRNAGVLGASTGDLVLSNSGWLSNSGSVYAKGNTSITTQGSIANTGSGLIAAQGNTTLAAQGANGSISSTTGTTLAAGMDSSGAVGTTGSLSVTAAAGANLNGQVASGADTAITAASIDVSGANVAVKGTLTAQAQTTLTTDSATVNAAQINLSAHDLSNAGGQLRQSGTGDMAIVLPGNLNNSGGTIASNAQNLTLGATTLTNTGGTIAHAGSGALAVNAGTFSGSGGTTVSNGALTLNASGALDLQNATTNAQQVSIQAASLGNQGGSIVQASSTGPAASINVASVLDNTGGSIGSNSALQINAGSLTNASGQITALQSLDITSSGTVDNSSGVTSVTGVTGNTSGMSPNAGLIRSNGALSVQAASVNNTGATIASAQDDVTIASDTIHNNGGQIVGAGNVTVHGNSGVNSGASSAVTLLDNTAGLVQSGDILSVNANQVINASTFTPTSGNTSNTTALGLVGNDVQLAVNTLNNQYGEILAGNNLVLLAAQSVDNSQGGLLYAGNALTVQDSAVAASPASSTPVPRTLQVTNTGGTLNAGASTQVVAASVSGDGQLLSQGSLNLDVSSDFNNTGVVNANSNATINSSGTVQNSGTVASGQTLSVTAANLNNVASGVLSGATGNYVVLSDTLTNRGLIDSGNSAGTGLTLIQAQTVNNLGTGRIYGDNIAIAANTLTNGAEMVSGVTKTAVIASRGTLDIGVQTLNNTNSSGYGSTILSLGDLSIGGTLDANNRATGAAVSVTNSASQIQSVNGNVAINAATLQNLNPYFSYSVVSDAPSAEKTEYVLTNGQTVQDSDVAMDNGMLHTYSVAGGNTTPYGKVLLKTDPLATAANIAIYQEPDVVSTTQVQIGTGGGHNGNDPVYETHTSVSAPQNSQIWALVGLTAPSNPPPSGDRPPETITTSGHFQVTVHNPDVDVWDAAAAPYIALQARITALRSSMDADMVTVQLYNAYTTAAQHAVVSGGTPGTISAGGNITVNASNSARNDNSRILAGGALAVNVPGGALDNTSTNVTVNTAKSGYSFYWECVNFPGTSVCGVAYYNQFNLAGQPNLRTTPFTQSIPTTVQVSSSQALANTSAVAPSALAAAATVGSRVVSAAMPALGLSASNSASSSNGAGPVNGPSSLFQLPNSSLYRINTSPTAGYLVETDPAFTNYNSWLSSDYITQRLALDPTVTQKRLGDGFYEQQLVREQVAQLTGQRFLGNYTSDQQEYQALMDSGLTYAQTYNLRPGIALTAAQVASLTTDIVWLEQQTVTLPDGSTTQALVPHVYAAIQPGDLAPSGALLGGKTVSIATSGDTTNTGTIAGRQLVQISANSINNTVGSISGQSVSLNAVQDINNVGGSIGADSSLILQAGRDINLSSTTQSSTASGYSGSQTGIDRVATLYTKGPGTLLASAGNNINLTAAQVSSGGDVQMAAGNNLTLSTITTSRSDNVGASNTDNHFLSSSSQEVGTSIKSVGNTSLAAGNTLQATAANVNATGDLSVNAANIVLLAGQSKASSDSVMTNSSSDWISSSKTVTKESNSSAQAQVSTLSGNNVTVTANQDLVSVGTKFTAADNLTVEGKDSQTFYAAKDTTQSSKSVDSSSSMFGGLMSSSSSSNDTSLKSVSIGSELQSTNAINVKVGNSATFEGSSLTANQIAFVQTDPSKAGQLNLNGSVDTTQTSHTEKSETLGVYQSTKGNGSTVETLSQTQIKGNVTFDQALKISVQIPKDVQATAGGQALQSQMTALGQSALGQTLASSPSGLAYLNQLKANPNVQWDKVALANEHWSYDQAGLTPAGAALLSIVVAAYTGGMGSEVLGGTAASSAGAATLMGSTTLATAVNAGFASLAAQTAVAMVNNQGDIGKTLAQLGSEQSIKNLLVTMTTAGVLDKLNSSMSIDGVKLSNINAQNAGLGANLAKNVVNNLANATITSTLTGANLEDSLKTALVSAAISAGAGQAANAIGDATVNDQVTKALAHALAGCVAGAAGSGSQGCSSGAIGAVVGELAAQWYDNPPRSKSPADVLNFAKVMSAAAGAITGDGSAQSVNTAVMTGANAVENNYLNHVDATIRAKLQNKMQSGQTLTADEQKQLNALNNLDATTTAAYLAACKTAGAVCDTATVDLNNAIASYHTNGALALRPINPRLGIAGSASVEASLQQAIGLENTPGIAQQSNSSAFQQFAAPELQTYIVGAAIGTAATKLSTIDAPVATAAGSNASTLGGAKEGINASSSANVNFAETQATLTQQVADLRATLPSGPRSGGNMGVAQIDIPGVQPTMAASSQVQAPTAAQAANGFVGIVPETFPSTVVPTGATPPVQLLRTVDSEAKILNNVAAQLGDNTTATGTINLLTERSPCASCSNVIDLFRAKYPNVTLNVFDNNGKLIPPTKKGP